MSAAWPKDVHPEMPEAPFRRAGDPPTMAELQRRAVFLYRVRLAITIALMVLGGTMLSVGIGITRGWAYGMAVAGGCLFVIGLLLGLSD